VWNRRWLALAVAWAVCLLGWLVVAMIPNTYESRARIFVPMRWPSRSASTPPTASATSNASDRR
jgi:uncharacterized protein involved in exopolysaccharide biosynthesis